MKRMLITLVALAGVAGCTNEVRAEDPVAAQPVVPVVATKLGIDQPHPDCVVDDLGMSEAGWTVVGWDTWEDEAVTIDWAPDVRDGTVGLEIAWFCPPR